MKYIITIALSLFCVSGFTQNNLFYYSEGEKHYLINDSSSVLILTKTIDPYMILYRNKNNLVYNRTESEQ